MASADSILEKARKGIVDGKTLQEWLDAPCGAFAKAVRENVDPFYQLQSEDGAEPIKWKVKVRYSYVPPEITEYATKTYEVWALTASDAQEAVEELFENDNDLERGEDHEIASVSDPVISENQDRGEK